MKKKTKIVQLKAFCGIWHMFTPQFLFPIYTNNQHSSFLILNLKIEKNDKLKIFKTFFYFMSNACEKIALDLA